MMRDIPLNRIEVRLPTDRLMELNKHGDESQAFGWSPLLLRQARCA